MYHGAVDDQFWHGKNQPGNQSNGGIILFGILGEENQNRPGTYRFSSTNGISINDALILVPDADSSGSGEYTKPRPGSLCVCLMTMDGSQAFIHGFLDPPKWDDEGESDTPVVGHQDDISSAGDKVYQTVGGAKLMLRRGGLVVVEGGAGTSLLLSPVNNQLTVRSTNFSHIASGYLARRGRKELGKTDPATQHEEEFQHQVGASYDRVKIRHGSLENDARRELTVSEVVVAGGQATTVTRTRETYYNDGKWFGEGPEYKWGGAGADEPVVLGAALVSTIKTLTALIRGITVPTAWGPSGPPLNSAQFTIQVDNQLDSILSDYMFTTKTPADLS